MSHSISTQANIPQRVLSQEEIQSQRIQESYRSGLREGEKIRQREIQNLRNELNQNVERVKSQVDNLNSKLKEAIIEQNERLNEQAALFYDQLEDQSRVFEQEIKSSERRTTKKIDDLRIETKNSIQNTVNYINKVYTAQQKQISDLDHKLSTVTHDVELLVQRNQAADEKAKILVSILEDQLKITNSLNFRKYCSSEYIEITDKFNGLNELPPEAICAIAHTGIKELVNLNIKIESARMEFEAKHIFTLKQIESILLEMNHNRNSIFFTDGHNNEIKNDQGKNVIVELDFWSEGEFSELEEKLNDLKLKLITGKTDINFLSTDIDNILNQTFEIYKRKHEVIDECIIKGNSSQIRAEVGDKAIEYLEKQFYYVIEKGYELNDQRNGYLVKMRNDDTKTDMVIYVHPETSSCYSLVVNSDSENYCSDELMINRANEINQSLREAGLQVGDASCCNENATRILKELYDTTAILKSKKEGGKPISQEALKSVNLSRSKRLESLQQH